VFAAGLSMAGLAPLRNRLLARVATLRAAVVGKAGPVNMPVGKYQEPLPSELEQALQPRPTPSPLDVMKRVYNMTPGSYPPVLSSSRVPSNRAVAKSGATVLPSPEGAEVEPPHASGLDTSEEGELECKTGAREQEAYQILLKSNPVLEGLIHGSNTALRFKSWDAAFKGNDIYWVRIIFQSEADTDAEYIWQVNLETKQASPLNFNARALF